MQCLAYLSFEDHFMPLIFHLQLQRLVRKYISARILIKEGFASMICIAIHLPSPPLHWGPSIWRRSVFRNFLNLIQKRILLLKL